MEVDIPNPPKTLMEVYRMLPEGTRAEIIDGTLYMSPAPIVNHQGVVLKLSSHLFFHCEEDNNFGKVYSSPIDVYLDERNAFQPDIIFIANANKKIIHNDGIHGAPDLVIEVLSPGTSKSDLTKKKPAYEKAGVKEYWMVDPKTKIAVGFHLVKNKYAEFAKEKGRLNSKLLKHVFKF
jgi:Uma2 family endonuclease